MSRAAEVHRANYAAGELQLCTLLSIKTGCCPEDCGYCSQSAHHSTGLKAGKLIDVDTVIASARELDGAPVCRPREHEREHAGPLTSSPARTVFSPATSCFTAANSGDDRDAALFTKLGVRPLGGGEPMRILQPAE